MNFYSFPKGKNIIVFINITSGKQESFYYRYKVVKIQSSIEFWNSIFLGNYHFLNILWNCGKWQMWIINCKFFKRLYFFSKALSESGKCYCIETKCRNVPGGILVEARECSHENMAFLRFLRSRRHKKLCCTGHTRILGRITSEINFSKPQLFTLNHNCLHYI